MSWVTKRVRVEPHDIRRHTSAPRERQKVPVESSRRRCSPIVAWCGFVNNACWYIYSCKCTPWRGVSSSSFLLIKLLKRDYAMSVPFSLFETLNHLWAVSILVIELGYRHGFPWLMTNTHKIKVWSGKSLLRGSSLAHPPFIWARVMWSSLEWIHLSLRIPLHSIWFLKDLPLFWIICVSVLISIVFIEFL